jgi:hypothetical protein
MRGLERCFPATRRFALAVGLMGALANCAPALSYLELSQTVGEAVSGLTSLPTTTTSLREQGPRINECIETPDRRICKSFAQVYSDATGMEQCFAILDQKRDPPRRDILTFAYRDEDMVDMDDEPCIKIVRYNGDVDRFVVPYYVGLNKSFIPFKMHFDNPTEISFHEEENDTDTFEKENPTLEQIGKFLKMTADQIKDCLMITAGQLIKTN